MKMTSRKWTSIISIWGGKQILSTFATGFIETLQHFARPDAHASCYTRWTLKPALIKLHFFSCFFSFSIRIHFRSSYWNIYINVHLLLLWLSQNGIAVFKSNDCFKLSFPYVASSYFTSVKPPLYHSFETPHTTSIFY